MFTENFDEHQRNHEGDEFQAARDLCPDASEASYGVTEILSLLRVASPLLFLGENPDGSAMLHVWPGSMQQTINFRFSGDGATIPGTFVKKQDFFFLMVQFLGVGRDARELMDNQFRRALSPDRAFFPRVTVGKDNKSNCTQWMLEYLVQIERALKQGPAEGILMHLELIQHIPTFVRGGISGTDETEVQIARKHLHGWATTFAEDAGTFARVATASRVGGTVRVGRGNLRLRALRGQARAQRVLFCMLVR